MSQTLTIHPNNPQPRLITQAADQVRAGNIIAYPTDSGYALGCQLGNKQAQQRIRTIRQLDKHHNFTLMCRNLAELGSYAHVDNIVYRLLKRHTPGPYTFILQATSEVPKRLVHPKRRTIGLRVPDHTITQALLTALAEPLMSVSWILLNEPSTVFSVDALDPAALTAPVDVIIDGGVCNRQPTSVIDLTADKPEIVRYGQGDVSPFEEG